MRSLTFSLTLRFAILLSATTLVVLLLVGWLLHDQGLRSLEVLHDGEYRELSDMLRREPDLKARQIGARIGQDTDSDSGLYYTEIRTREGALLFRSSNLGDNRLPEEIRPGSHFTAQIAGLGEVRVSNYADEKLLYAIASPLAPIRGVMNAYLRIALILFLCVSLAGIAITYGFARLALRPIRLIREAALEINADNLGRRIVVPGSRDELAALTVLLNQMFDRLQVAFEQNRRFAADASHELKTPLAVLRLQAEKLRPVLSADPIGLSQLEEILEEAAHMHRIIESLLFLAKTESGTLEVSFKAHALSQLLQDLRTDAEVLAEDAGVQVRFEAGRDATVRCEPVLIFQMALNLISNALRFCEKGGTVTIRSEASDETWTFQVLDEGPGVSPEQIGQLFQRFRQLGQTPAGAGTRATSGHGLGLAIAKGVVTLHGGTISAENRQDRSGLCVTVKLPINPQKA